MARVRRSSSPNVRRSRLLRARHWTAVGGVLASVAIAAPARAGAAVTPEDDWAAARPYSEGQMQPGQARRFDIPQGPLDEALRALETASGTVVVVSGDLTRGLSTAGVSGAMTIEQALSGLLAGTGLSARIAGKRTRSSFARRARRLR